MWTSWKKTTKRRKSAASARELGYTTSFHEHRVTCIRTTPHYTLTRTHKQAPHSSCAWADKLFPFSEAPSPVSGQIALLPPLPPVRCPCPCEGGGGALDGMLDPVPASVCQVPITVHFTASSLLCCARPSLSAGVSLQKSPAATFTCCGISVADLRKANCLFRTRTKVF